MKFYGGTDTLAHSNRQHRVLEGEDVDLVGFGDHSVSLAVEKGIGENQKIKM